MRWVLECGREEWKWNREKGAAAPSRTHDNKTVKCDHKKSSNRFHPGDFRAFFFEWSTFSRICCLENDDEYTLNTQISKRIIAYKI